MIVVSHGRPDDVPEGQRLQLRRRHRARARGGEARRRRQGRDRHGGADIGQQYLRANLIDELSLHIAPVLFGSGTQMFDAVTELHRNVELISVIYTANALHLRARVER